ncbi:MAG TPA: PxKF domain-containing protein, partial [Propionibacteriaceae bacterium]|nr:PxKF domain-containing protein [Propionibacteriaceae bacterium]
AISPAAASTTWWNIATGVPTATYTCDDALSGVASCTPSKTFGEGTNQSDTGTALDKAGNTTSITVDKINVDLTAPGITWTGGPSNGARYYFGQVPATATCAATDALSGPKDCTVTGYSTAVGTHTLTATAHDVAGNVTTQTRPYTVLAWTLGGFYQPVDMGTVWNTVKNGSTVPLKFEVFAGPTELTDTAVVDSFTVKSMSCSVTATVDDIDLTTTGGTSLRYDTTAGQFVQNWQTPKTPGACYQVTMTTDDGSHISANFKLK